MPILNIHEPTVIVDLDGTVLRTNGLHVSAEAVVLQRQGIIIDEEQVIQRFAGISSKVMFRIVMVEAGRSAPTAEDLHRMHREKWEIMDQLPDTAFKVIRGTVSKLRSLHARGVRLAIASAAPMHFIERGLTVTRLHPLFRVLASTEEVPHGKPKPDVLYLAAQRLGHKPGKPLPPGWVYVGDGTADMEAAKAAGIRGFALADFRRSDVYYKAGAKRVVGDLQDIPETAFIQYAA